MPNEYETLARMLMNAPQAGKLLGNLDKLSAMINSPEGHQFLATLANGGGDALGQAAASALEGDKDKARSLLSSLLSTDEGAALAAKMMKLAERDHP